MKKKDGSVDDGPVDESFIHSSPHVAVAGGAAADATRETIIMTSESCYRTRRRRRVS